MTKKTPHTFVLDALEKLSPYTKAMFGATAVYINEKIIFILRERETSPNDNGVWIATTPEYHSSLKKVLPSMRSIEIFGPGPTGWQIIPSSADNFEEETLQACELVLKSDPRIGKIPKQKKPRKK